MSEMLTRSRNLSTAALKVINDVAKQRFVIPSALKSQDDAVIIYEQQGSKIIFYHTEVPQQFQGKGVGKVLAQHAFEYAQQNNLEVVCKCDFLAHFFEKNSNKYKGLQIKVEV